METSLRLHELWVAPVRTERGNFRVRPAGELCSEDMFHFTVLFYITLYLTSSGCGPHTYCCTFRLNHGHLPRQLTSYFLLLHNKYY